MGLLYFIAGYTRIYYCILEN